MTRPVWWRGRGSPLGRMRWSGDWHTHRLLGSSRVRHTHCHTLRVSETHPLPHLLESEWDTPTAMPWRDLPMPHLCLAQSLSSHLPTPWSTAPLSPAAVLDGLFCPHLATEHGSWGEWWSGHAFRQADNFIVGLWTCRGTVFERGRGWSFVTLTLIRQRKWWTSWHWPYNHTNTHTFNASIDLHHCMDLERLWEMRYLL